MTRKCKQLQVQLPEDAGSYNQWGNYINNEYKRLFYKHGNDLYACWNGEFQAVTNDLNDCMQPRKGLVILLDAKSYQKAWESASPFEPKPIRVSQSPSSLFKEKAARLISKLDIEEGVSKFIQSF